MTNLPFILGAAAGIGVVYLFKQKSKLGKRPDKQSQTQTRKQNTKHPQDSKSSY